jgi:chemotaxis protein MotB
MKMLVWLSLCGLALLAMPGCVVAPRSELNSAQVQNRALLEQNKAQLAEIDNLKAHARDLEDRVIRSEKQTATLREQAGLDQKRIESFERERDGLYDQFKSLAFGHGRLPPELSRQLAELSQRYPSLQFDPETGISKLDTDILFDTGDATLKPGARQMLDELAHVLKSSTAGQTKLMIAGHTDNQTIVGRDVRDRYPNNFHLSTARALAVADRMKQAGLPASRLGVAGFGPYQPVASNATAQDRQKNRRVEIFVMPSDVPVIGWSDSTPSVYGSGAGVRR